MYACAGVGFTDVTSPPSMLFFRSLSRGFLTFLEGAADSAAALEVEEDAPGLALGRMRAFTPLALGMKLEPCLDAGFGCDATTGATEVEGAGSNAGGGGAGAFSCGNSKER